MTWFRCGGGSGMPADLKNRMNAVFNKKFGTAVDYPAEGWPDDVNLMGVLQEKTIVFWPFCDFNDGADDVPTKAVKISIPPTLTGVSEVSEKQTGKNILDFTVRSQYGITTTKGTDGGAIISGTASGGNVFVIDFVAMDLDAGKYNILVSGMQTGMTASWTKNGAYGGALNEGSNVITLSAKTTIGGYVRVTNGSSYPDPVTVYVQLTIGQDSEAFEKYDPTDYSAELGRTIHGGEVDIVNGTGTDSYDKDSMTSAYLSGLSSSYIGYEASTNYFGGHPTIWVRNWNYQTAKIRQAGGIGCVCNYFPVSMHNTDIINTQNRIYFDVNGKGISDVSGFIAFVQNLEANNESLDIVYELNDTYTTDFTFDGQEIPTRLGYNCFISEQGDTSVTYRASGTVYNYPAAESEEF